MSFRTKKEERNIVLARLVEDYPVLYDYNHESYSNRAIQDEAWRSIAEQMEESGELEDVAQTRTARAFARSINLMKSTSAS